jgi:biopolymer transport protein TolR
MRRQRRLMNQINVVPYIDVMLVLLIIFMVTTPMMQTGAVNLPSVAKAPSPPSQAIEVRLNADLTLLMHDRSRGGKEAAVSEDELVANIQQAQASNPEQSVVIAADKNVRYEAVMNLMDLLQRNQVQKVGLLVQPGKK